MPITVVIAPVPTATMRTRKFAESDIYRFPSASRAMSRGRLSRALVAEPPLPVFPAVPVPAMVLMTPVVGLIDRTTWQASDDTKTMPVVSTATPNGPCMLTEVACPPLVLSQPVSIVPAKRVMIPPATRRMALE